MAQKHNQIKIKPDRKTVIITGASSGLGYSLAVFYLKNNWNVSAIARRKKLLEQLLQYTTDKHQLLIIQCDVSRKTEVKKALQNTLIYFGNIDAVIHNAGISQRSIAADTDLSVYEKIMNVNFYALVNLFHASVGELRKSKGSLIAISSVQGKFATQLRSGYAASKHAVQGFMDSIRLEEDTIHVMTVCPGFIKTDVSKNALTADGSAHKIMDDAIEMGQFPDDVAQIIYRSAEKHSREIYPAKFREKAGVYLARYCPPLLNFMLKRVKVT